MTEQSIVALVTIILSSISALVSTLSIIINNNKVNKLKREEQKISLFFSNYYSAINEFACQFANYHDHSSHKKDFLSSIFKVMIFCSFPLQEKLQSLAESVILQSTSTPNYETSDKLFYDCLSSLKKEFGLQNLLGKKSQIPFSINF